MCIRDSIYANESLACIGEDGQARPLRASKIQVYEGLQLAEVDKAQPGDIVVVAGIEDVTIGDTICTRENPRALPRIRVDEPTVAMRFGINTSPLAGREGKLVQSRMIRDRLNRECLRNVAVRVEDTTDKDAFLVKGRGEFQMAILIETMRREGFELSVGRPEVILKKDENGKTLEPIEHLYVDCDEVFMGVVTDKINQRKGRMLDVYKRQGHAAAAAAGLFLGGLDAFLEVGEVQRVAGFDLAVELKDRALVEDVLHVPFGLHGEVVAAMAAHARELGEQIGAPEVEAAVRGAVGAGDGTVDLVARRQVVPLAHAVVVHPVGKGGQFLGRGLLFRRAGDALPGAEEAALEHIPFAAQLCHDVVQLCLLYTSRCV